MKILETLYALAGWTIFLAAIVITALQYGSRWEFGPHGLMKLLVTEDGHYNDGAEVSEMALSLHNAGLEEAYQLAAIGGIVALFAYYAYTVLLLKRRID